jgi:geranylgeranyl pyrophosphate synthase
LAKANRQQVKILSDFGLNAGIAFQITDDLLDITGDEKRTGKTTGSDAEKHKPTLAVIHLLKTVDQKDRTKLIKTYLNGDYKQESFIEMLTKSGSLEYAQKQAQKYVAKAINTLKKLPQTEAKNALIETSEFMTNRTS